MIGLALKVLGVGLAGSALSYGAYLGIEDIKGKASTDYPAYYGNKNYRTVYSGLKPHSNVMLKYGEEEKGKKLSNSKSSGNTEYNKDKPKLENLNLEEDGQKYRHGCTAYLRKFVMNGIGDKNILEQHCLFDHSLAK